MVMLIIAEKAASQSSILNTTGGDWEKLVEAFDFAVSRLISATFGIPLI